MNEATYQAQLKRNEDAYNERLNELKEEIEDVAENINLLIAQNPDYAKELRDHLKDIL